MRLEVDLGHDVLLGAMGGSDVIISPDGTRIAYLSRGRMFTRKLDQPNAGELPVTPGATSPFFSPDGQWIGYTASGKLRKVSVDGGSEVVLCDAGSSYTGNDWGEDGYIVMALRPTTGLFRVSSAGGTPVPITQLQGEDRTHRWPQILPGGKAVLFTAQNSLVGYDDASIQVVTLADGHTKTVQRGGTFGRYLPASDSKGYLTYVNRGTLFAVGFDLKKLETIGSPLPVLQQVSYSSQFGSAKLSFSRGGTLVYRSSDLDTSRVAIQWLSADGKKQPLLDKPGLFIDPRLSPDGQQLVVVRNELHSSSNTGLWIYDLRRDTLTPLAQEKTGSHPVWTPDGKYIIYGTSQGIFSVRADGGGKPQPLTHSNEAQFPTSISRDSKRLAFFQYEPQGGSNFWTVTVERNGEVLKASNPEVFLQNSAGTRDASFSPDGRWLAYASNESGNYQVYVRAFPDKGGRWQISTTNGTSPIFSPNRKDLFFYDVLDDRIMVASYSAKGDAFLAEKARVWSGENVALPLNAAVGAQYDVAPDGKRIIAGTYTGGVNPTDSGHVIFLQNFVDELQRKIPAAQK